MFIKYNKTLGSHYHAHYVIDPICLDNIYGANKWLTRVPGNYEDEVFDGDSDFTWGDIVKASGVRESI